MAKDMYARYAGKCNACGEGIKKGDRIMYDGRATHYECAKSGPRNAKPGFYVVLVEDPRIMGFSRGSIRETPMKGPFSTYEAAMPEKARHKALLMCAGNDSMYYVIREFKGAAGATTQDYEYLDGDREFEDVQSAAHMVDE